MRSERSSISNARWSGKSVNARRAWLVVWRVVSLPATDSSTKNAPISSGSSRSPSTSVCTSALIRSSPGSSARWSAISRATAVSSSTPRKFISSGSRPARTSGSFQPTSSSALWRTVSRSSSGTPIISEMVIIGRRWATSLTKSHSPSGATSSTIRRAWSAICSSMRFTCRGVKAAFTSPRTFVWRGASIARKDIEASSISGSASSNITPSPEQNVSGLRLTSRTSWWRTTAQ